MYRSFFCSNKFFYIRKRKRDHKGVSFSYLIGMIVLLCRLFLFIGEPLLLGGAFLVLLLNRSFWLGINRGFIGLVLFIVYVGGTIVLFTYCLMLSPLQFFSKQKKYYSVVLLTLRRIVFIVGSIGIYEFFAFLGVLLIIGILLFIVMLRVVELIDFSRGSLRVECG